MDMEHISTFLELEKTRNFSRTAEALNISQTAVSARIKTLEAELGQKLFLRNNKLVQLSVSGQQFLDYANRILALAQEGKMAVQKSNRYERFFTIAAPDSIWNHSLLPRLNRYLDQNKKTAFTLRSSHSETIITDILNHKVDIAITLIKPVNTEIKAIPYFQNQFYLVGHTRLRASLDKLTAQNINEVPFIDMNWGELFHKWLCSCYTSNLFSLQVERIFLFTSLLLSGRGIGFMPERSAQEYLESGRLVSFDFEGKDSIPQDTAYIIYLKRMANLVEPFLEEFLE